MTTFYFMMGIYVHLDGDFFKENFGYSILVSCINVLVSPIIICILGWFAGLQARTVIYTSGLSNSMGETTLTLQVLAYEAGIFSKGTFLNLVVSTMLSLVGCCIGTVFIDQIYAMLRSFFTSVLDKPSKAEEARIQARQKELGDFQNHVVILGWNETGMEVSEHFRELKRDVIVIDLDYRLHEVFSFVYKGTLPKKPPRCVVSAVEHTSALLKSDRPPACCVQLIYSITLCDV
eukprot:Tamp_03296.p2 GENE.Tamp_03296~~Tamp_03296.p2  ORF type:complete len:233 (+),score=43.51 Tamp_03296:1437-2135(+)